MKLPLVYLAAASHSGSTLTAMLLSSHPNLASVGELKATNLADPDRYLCSCHSLLRDCEFWQQISAEMQSRGHDFSIFNAGTDIRSGSGPYCRRLLRPLVRSDVIEFCRDILLNLDPGWRRRLSAIQTRNADLVASVQKVTGAAAVVDSSKIGIRLKYLLRNPALDVKVIWLTRDGRGVAQAYKDPGRFADASDPALRGGGVGVNSEGARDIRRGAREWMRCNQETQSVLANLPTSRWLKVSYEALCTDTLTTLRRICDFIGVEPADIRLDFKHVAHHVLGNGMRLDVDDSIALDERWRDELSDEELAAYFREVGDYHFRLGYGRE